MLRFLTAGESHGPELTAILEGMPAGLSLSSEQLDIDLARRQQGYGSGGRMKIERDHARITSGVMAGAWRYCRAAQFTRKLRSGATLWQEHFAK